MNGWRLVYHRYDPDQEGLREALCTLGNGYFATRGAAPDSFADGVHYPGTYLAGGYNRLATEIAGHTVENEDLVNLPNWLPLVMRVGDGPWLRIDEVEILDFRQELDLRRGVLERSLRFRDGDGRTTRWDERRLVSMADPHLAGLAVAITAEDWSGPLTVRTGLDGSVVNDGVARYRDLNGRHLETLEAASRDEEILFLRGRMRQSRREVAVAARTRVYDEAGAGPPRRHTEILPDIAEQEIGLDIAEGRTVTVEKIVSLFTSRDHAMSEPVLDALKAVERAGRFADLLAAHAHDWGTLWEDCDIQIGDDADSAAEMKLHLHVFHILQTVSRHSVDLDISVPPRGWHGEAYRGHIMWDELFVFPFLNLRMPVLTEALLRYRYRRLPEARHAALEAGVQGAKFPWQSGSDGREESQSLHLNPMSGRWIPDTSQRQYHINAAVAYNIWQYYQVTDDQQFLRDYGAEVMLEIARFWASVATYNAERDRYEIRGVMGPDEFHTAYPGADPVEEGGIDNNAYTNVMVSWMLTRIFDLLDFLPEDHCRRLCEALGIRDEEIALWEEISRKLYVPFHDDQIISQFEGYGDLEEFDWKGYQKKYGNIQRLDRILEKEGDTPNRYKASKQADVLMLFYLFSADELTLMFERLGYPFKHDTIPRNIEYYVARTSHGSTLSQVVHSWVLARSDRTGSWRLFCQALDSDVADIQGGTTPEGIHLGAMAGTVDLIQRCYTGIETRANVLHFDPSLPEDLDRLRTTLRYRGHTLDVDITRELLSVTSRPATATPVSIAYRGHFRTMAPGRTHRFHIIPSVPRDGDAAAGAAAPGTKRRA